MSSLSIAGSGVRSAELRLAASAHNVANLVTPSFRPLRAIQTSVEGGGSAVHLQQEPLARNVDLAHELVEQMQATFQFKASLRALATASDTRGHLIDLLA